MAQFSLNLSLTEGNLLHVFYHFNLKLCIFTDFILVFTLLSRQTESVRDHKFHSGYAHSLMDRGHFISHLHQTQEQTERDSGASQSLRFSQMR